MKTYNITEYTAYSTIMNTPKQYAVYEDIDGQKQNYMVALFADFIDAQEYADKKNYVDDVVKEAME